MIQYLVTQDGDPNGNDKSTLRTMRVGRAFKTLMNLISVFGGQVAECTPTRIFIRTPSFDDYGYTFDGEAGEMEALWILALYFQKAPAKPRRYEGENLIRTQGYVRSMFRLDAQPIVNWKKEMNQIMVHLDSGKAVGSLV